VWEPAKGHRHRWPLTVFSCLKHDGVMLVTGENTWFRTELISLTSLEKDKFNHSAELCVIKLFFKYVKKECLANLKKF